MTSDAGRLGRTFSSLRVRNYRLFFVGQLGSMIGTWMQAVALAVLVLRLTSSGTALGLVTAARFLPFLLLTPLAGLIADRVDKRRLLYLTQTGAGLLAAAFAVLIATGTITIGLVYLLALALGLVSVLDNPARQSLIAELVPQEDVGNAVVLNSVSINAARIFGAAIGGAIVTWIGLAMCFAVNAVSFAAVLATVALLRPDEIRSSVRVPRERGQVRAGLRYVAATPELLVPLVMLAVVGALAWEFQVALPLMASDTFHGDAGTYGVMTAFMGLGAVVGGVLVAYRGRPARARSLSVAAAGWGVAILAAAFAPTLPLELAALVLVGYGSIAFNTLAKTALQLASDPQMRGRVMALWALAWGGSTPVGGPLVGWVGEVLGARWSLVAGGLPTVLVGLLAWPVLTRIDHRDSPTAAPTS